MKPSLKVAFLFAAIWIGLKLLFNNLGLFQDDIRIPGLINMFFLVAAVSFGLYLEKKKEGFGAGTAMTDIKNAMTAGVPYILIVSIFMYFYYDRINPTFIENRKTERMDQYYENMQRPTYVDSLKLQNPDVEALSDEEIYRKIKEETDGNLAPYSMFIFSLLGLLIMAVTFSIFITLIFRKILFREYE